MTEPRGWTVTEEWLRAHGTGGIAWNAAQLRAVGVAWPPRKGWIGRLVGTMIPLSAKNDFESFRYTEGQRILKRAEWEESRRHIPASEQASLDAPGRCVKCGEDAPKRFDGLCAFCYSRV